MAKDKLGVIARKMDGEAIGYFAVIPKDNSRIAKVAETVVSPKYRRNGVMSSMMEYLTEIAKSRQLTMLLDESVTVHPVSQKVNNKFEYKTTALQLASSVNVKYKGFNEEYPQPVPMALDFLPILHPAGRPLFLPETYSAMILETYDELAMNIMPGEVRNVHLAEIEFQVLMGQCLNRRLDTIEKVRREVSAWEMARNNMKATINWHFTTDDARIKLTRLYPTIEG